MFEFITNLFGKKESGMPIDLQLGKCESGKRYRVRVSKFESIEKLRADLVGQKLGSGGPVVADIYEVSPHEDGVSAWVKYKCRMAPVFEVPPLLTKVDTDRLDGEGVTVKKKMPPRPIPLTAAETIYQSLGKTAENLEPLKSAKPGEYTDTVRAVHIFKETLRTTRRK